MSEFASAGLTMRQIETIVKRLGGEDGALSFIRGDLEVVERFPLQWTEENSVIYFSLTSDGTTGGEWINRFERKGVVVDSVVKQVICSKDFIPTKGMTTEVVVIKGCFFINEKRNDKSIRATAETMKLLKPSMELAYLIGGRFISSDIRSMGLSRIVIMGEPYIYNGHSVSLFISGAGDRLVLNPYYEFDGDYTIGTGFAFAKAVTFKD